MSTDKRHGFNAPLLSVVMPVYNERITIEEIIRRVRDIEIDKEIIIVDDYSTDGTREYLTKLSTESAENGSSNVEGRSLKILFQDRNYGKGAALRRGFSEATGQIVVIQDADLDLDRRSEERRVEPFKWGAPRG